jgi:hypothetical protein
LQARLLASLVVLALVAAMTASVVGLHAHVLADGRVVVHSHPTDRSDRGKTHHQHSGHDYIVFANLGRLSPTQIPDMVNPLTRWVTCVHRLEFSNDTAPAQADISSPNKRSPPEAALT